MRYSRFMVYSALFGLLVSVGFIVFWGLIDRFAPGLYGDVTALRFMMAVWPTSVINFAATASFRVEVICYTVSALTNVFFYMLIGSMIWLGLNRHRIFFLLCTTILGMMWWRIFTL